MAGPLPALPPDYAHSVHAVWRWMLADHLHYFPRLHFLTGSVPCSILLARAFMLTAQSYREHGAGWFRQTQAQWQKQIGMGRAQIEHCRAQLIGLGILEERRHGMPLVLEYRISAAGLRRALADATRRPLPPIEWLNERNRLTVLGNYETVLRPAVHLTGSINAALLLSGLIRQAAEAIKHRGPAQRPLADLLQRTRLTPKAFRTARDTLKARRLIAEHRAGIPPVVYLWVDARILLQDMQEMAANSSAERACVIPAASIAGIRQFNSAQISKQALPNSADRNCLDPQTEVADSSRQDQPDSANRTGPNPPTCLPIRAGSAYIGKTQKETTTTTEHSFVLDEGGSSRSWNELVWPNGIARQAAAACLDQLRPAHRELAQALLDELDYQLRQKAVANPAGYLAALVRRANEGNFVPAGALVIAQRRRQRDIANPATSAATTGSATSISQETSRQQGLAMLAQMKGLLRRPAC